MTDLNGSNVWILGALAVWAIVYTAWVYRSYGTKG